jgi:hypothetical protein
MFRTPLVEIERRSKVFVKPVLVSRNDDTTLGLVRCIKEHESLSNGKIYKVGDLLISANNHLNISLWEPVYINLVAVESKPPSPRTAVTTAIEHEIKASSDPNFDGPKLPQKFIHFFVSIGNRGIEPKLSLMLYNDGTVVKSREGICPVLTNEK